MTKIELATSKGLYTYTIITPARMSKDVVKKFLYENDFFWERGSLECIYGVFNTVCGTDYQTKIYFESKINYDMTDLSKIFESYNAPIYEKQAVRKYKENLKSIINYHKTCFVDPTYVPTLNIGAYERGYKDALNELLHVLGLDEENKDES